MSGKKRHGFHGFHRFKQRLHGRAFAHALIPVIPVIRGFFVFEALGWI
jgi:hypothetical protein